MNLQLDMPRLQQALSPSARAFVAALFAHDAETSLYTIRYLPSWRKRPDIRERFFALTLDERVEALSFLMVPIHEYRHHFDMLTTPFGAWFHLLDFDLYRVFQPVAIVILRALGRRGTVGPTSIVSLDAWLNENHAKLDPDAVEQWQRFERRRTTLEAWGDFGDVRACDVIADPPGPPVPFMGDTFKFVIVNHFFETFTRKQRETWEVRRGDWFLTPSTILEGRAVIACLLWGIDQLEGHPEAGKTLAAWLRNTYETTDMQNYEFGDYRFLADAAASWLGRPSAEDLLEGPIPLLRSATALQIMNLAGWFALHAPPPKVDEPIGRSNPCYRLFADLSYVRYLAASGEFDAFLRDDFFDRFEASPFAKYAPHDASVSLTQSISLLEAALEAVQELDNPQVAGHFEHVLLLVVETLRRRVGGGYRWPTAHPTNGNVLTSASAEEDKKLLRPYEAPHWVREWHDFRHQTFFQPRTASVTAKYLRELFGLDHAVINCECGTMIDAEISKFAPCVSLDCENCGRHHMVRTKDMTKFFVGEREGAS